MKFASWSTRFQAFLKTVHYIITNVHHFYIYCAIHMKKIGFYVYLGGGTAKITDFKQKIKKIAFRKHVFLGNGQHSPG